jgi:hypothetical protein
VEEKRMQWHDLSEELAEGRQWAELDDLPGVLLDIEQVAGRYRIVGVVVRDAEGVTEDMLRAVPIRRIEASIVDHAKAETKRVNVDGTSEAGPPTKHELRLRVPKTRRYPDEFFEKVASLYWRCVAGGIAPAPAIAWANKQRRTTVHAWIKEARQRGVLAPARKQGSTG